MARSLLNVCFLKSLARRVMMDVMLERSPNKPKQEKRTPSHQNSYCFHTYFEIIPRTEQRLLRIKPPNTLVSGCHRRCGQSPRLGTCFLWLSSLSWKYYHVSGHFNKRGGVNWALTLYCQILFSIETLSLVKHRSLKLSCLYYSCMGQKSLLNKILCLHYFGLPMKIMDFFQKFLTLGHSFGGKQKKFGRSFESKWKSFFHFL